MAKQTPLIPSRAKAKLTPMQSQLMQILDFSGPEAHQSGIQGCWLSQSGGGQLTLIVPALGGNWAIGKVSTGTVEHIEAIGLVSIGEYQELPVGIPRNATTHGWPISTI